MRINKRLNVFLTALVLMRLIYDRHFNTLEGQYKLKIAYPQYMLKHPYSEPKRLEFNITYNKLVDIDFKFVITPNVCDSDDQFLLLVMVFSMVDNLNRRELIRAQWGHFGEAIRVVFIFGDDGVADHLETLTEESINFKDIVLGDFFDSYYNLTYKYIMSMNWAAFHCPTARYIIKVDEDVFIHYGELMKFLVRDLSPWGAESVVASIFWDDSRVIRDNSSKWFVPEDEYDLTNFPRYCMGGFAIYSQDALAYLLEAAETTQFFFIDDVFITGFVADKVGMPRTNIQHLYLHRNFLRNLWKWGIRGVSRYRTFLFGPINLTTEEMWNMWSLMPGNVAPAACPEIFDKIFFLNLLPACQERKIKIE